MTTPTSGRLQYIQRPPSSAERRNPVIAARTTSSSFHLHRTAGHFDNQFRLLREDMLYEMREEFQVACGKREKARAVTMLQKLSLMEVFFATGRRQHPCGMAISCLAGLEALMKLDPDGRKDFLKREKSYLRHQAFGCLLLDQEIVSLATVDRQVDFLLMDPPQIVLRVIGEEAVKKTLLYFKLYDDIHFLFVDAPVFACEPILRCLQEKVELPLAKELLEHLLGTTVALSHINPSSVLEDIHDQETSLQDILGAKKPITLDPSQRESMLCGLTKRVSLIQGPPGMLVKL
jgi:hypothetical protein